MMVTSGQSIFDVALQHCGTIEAAFDIAQQNGLSLTDDLTVGQELITPAVINPKVVQYYAANLVQPATGIGTEEINEVLGVGEGIGWWRVGVDFQIG